MYNTLKQQQYKTYANEVVDESFELLRSRYQINLETSMIGSDFIFDTVQLMHCKCHKIKSRHGGSYTDSPDWIKKKKAIINPKNEDHQCFQYPVTVALNYGEIELHPERLSNIKPFINKYNWKRINYLSKMDDWKTFEKIIKQLLLIFCISKKNKYVQVMSQKLI